MNTRSVAELVICLIVALSRKLGDIYTKMHNGIWNKKALKADEKFISEKEEIKPSENQVNQ